MRNKSFAVFIMVHGRPEKDWTYRSLRKFGYTGQIYLVADDMDETRHDYKKKYKDELIIFNKKEVAKGLDSGDNSGDMRSTLYSASNMFNIAKERGIKYFFIMCDDYSGFYYNFNKNLEFKKTPIKNLDKVFDIMIEFYKTTPVLTLAMAQAGDFIGGKDGGNAEVKLLRKAMNTFLCSTDRPFRFMGRLNEDVTTYVNLGGKGKLFLTITSLCVIQNMHQKEKSGLTDVYLDYGTYVKSFFSVMYNPSCVLISDLGTKHKRIHHKVKWKNAVPKILNEKYKKNGTK
jgi:hypothetical protein